MPPVQVQPVQDVELETQRLQALVPMDFTDPITIGPSPDIRPVLIQTKSLNPRDYSIQIDFIRWFLLDIDQRNLLFWHEISRIQNRIPGKHRSDLVTLAIGLSAVCIEGVDQNIGALAFALTVSGLAVYQIYQHNWGERHLRNAVAADQSAIAFATAFGYSRWVRLF